MTIVIRLSRRVNMDTFKTLIILYLRSLSMTLDLLSKTLATIHLLNQRKNQFNNNQNKNSNSNLSQKKNSQTPLLNQLLFQLMSFLQLLLNVLAHFNKHLLLSE